jgi:thioredoxin reductase
MDLSKRPFTVVVDSTTYRAHCLIISSGASARWLGIPGEARALGQYGGRGVSACATCDGFFFRQKKVAVVGGGELLARPRLCWSVRAAIPRLSGCSTRCRLRCWATAK